MSGDLHVKKTTEEMEEHARRVFAEAYTINLALALTPAKTECLVYAPDIATQEETSAYLAGNAPQQSDSNIARSERILSDEIARLVKAISERDTEISRLKSYERYLYKKIFDLDADVLQLKLALKKASDV